MTPVNQENALRPMAAEAVKPSPRAPAWVRMVLLTLRTMLWWAAVATVAYFAAGHVFFLDTQPFGIGVLCAVNGSAAVAALLGCVLAAQAIPETALIYTAVYVVVFLLRVSVDILFYKGSFPPPRAFFRESVGVKISLSVLAALALGTYELIVHGYLYYDVFRMAFFAALTAVFVCFLSGGLRPVLFMGGIPRATAATVVFLGVTLLGGWQVGGVHVGLILALMAVLYTAHGYGAAAGAAFGILLALPLEVSYSATEISPLSVLGVVGLSAGAFFPLSPYLALAVATVTGLGVAVTLGGFGGLMLLLPELLSTAVLMYPLLKYDILPVQPTEVTVGAPIKNSRIRHTEEKLEMLSRTFATLSELATGLVRRTRGDRYGGGDACVAACEQMCQRCTSHRLCWVENRRETVGAIGEMTEALRARGVLETEDVPKALTARCTELHRIVSELSSSYAAYGQQETRWGKGRENSAFVPGYGTISRLFRRVLYEEKEAFAPDEALTARVSHGMRKANFPAEAVTVYGGRRKCVVVEDVQVAGLEMGCDDVRKLFENLSGLRLTTPEFAIDGRRMTMTLRTRRCFEVESSYQTNMISGESANGDTVTTFYGVGDRFYALISDGMGSGTDAADTSGLCGLLLEQLLTAGNDRETALELLNDFIRQRQVECSATVDLAEIDLITGEGCFSKSGAAPTFIKRGEDVFKLQAKTIPVGIARSTDAEHVRFPLKSGDVVVMISDGVAAGFEESGWLLRLIDEAWTEDLDEMCRRILDGARENNLRTDDMTVCLVRVK
ncbi:MAG: SpoIIE family protein phosphatase [Clostridia bacterium]|nr:SpoIIE family protein phosphatase [Clostridia bacterium]